MADPPDRPRSVVARLILVAAIVFGSVALYYGWFIVPYLVVSGEYERLMAGKPKTRAEVDRILGSWSHQPIEKSESMYGRHFAIKGRFEQYSVLGEPIDVVYDENDRVVVILPSYE